MRRRMPSLLCESSLFVVAMACSLVACCSLATWLLVDSRAMALTRPMTGATVYPTTGPRLRLPFPVGARVRIDASFGPSNGSGLHSNLTSATHGNDYYALDLSYADEPNSGHGLPIVAAIPGTVVKAGWSSAGWANFGIRVILRHDLGDGHTYYTLYAHLNALAPGIEEGVTVSQGQVLGELGRSCQGALSCSSFSYPHVHFSVHRNSMIGGSGTGGSYGGNAVVPEPIDGYEDLLRGQVLTSMNTSVDECGDGFCSGEESHDSCPDDCPVCEPIPETGRIVDETDICFSRGGEPAYWNEASGGWDGSLLWTHAIDGPVNNYGIWELNFAEAGQYRIEIYADALWADSQAAEYQVTHAGGTDRVPLDQTAFDGWREIGTWAFAAGGGQQVRLDDSTGETYSLRRRIVFDAIRLTRTDGGGTGNEPDGGTRDVDGGYGEGKGGCGCRAAPVHAPLELGSLVVLGLLLRLMRRRQR